MTPLVRETILAAGFLTRLPLPEARYSDAAMARAVRLYPWVGLAIGAALAALFLVLAAALPQTLAAILTVGAGMVLTGALHEDGLADLADGLGGGRTRDRALDIMRDSRIGSYGALALGMTLALKIAALTTLPTAQAAAALVGGHALGRFVMAGLMRRLPYARETGAAGFMQDASEGGAATLYTGAAAATLVLALATGPLAALTALALSLALAALLARRLRARLGGYTGDALGAAEQITEAAVPLALLAWL